MGYGARRGRTLPSIRGAGSGVAAGAGSFSRGSARGGSLGVASGGRGRGVDTVLRRASIEDPFAGGFRRGDTQDASGDG